MKKILLTTAMIASFGILHAQQDSTLHAQQDSIPHAQPDTIWRTGGLFSLNFTQVSLTNWAAGGQNSISGNSIINYFANYKKGKNAWDNTFILGYGLINQGRDEQKKTTKSDDRIDISSKYGHVATDHWFYSALLNFRSQFTNGYNYPNDSTVISKFLAPGYVIFSLGMDYMPNDNFSFFISPATARFIIVNDKILADEGAFGVDSGKTEKTEIGAYTKIAYKKNLSKTVFLQTEVDLFSNYLDKPQNIVVNWQLLATLKVSKVISASLNTNLIYDDKTTITGYKSDGVTVAFRGPRIQFNEALGIGIAYKFSGVTVR